MNSPLDVFNHDRVLDLVLGEELLQACQVLRRHHDVGGSARDGIGPEVKVSFNQTAQDFRRVLVQGLGPQDLVPEKEKKTLLIEFRLILLKSKSIAFMKMVLMYEVVQWRAVTSRRRYCSQMISWNVLVI